MVYCEYDYVFLSKASVLVHHIGLSCLVCCVRTKTVSDKCMHFAQAARGDAIIAEILRLSKNVPPVFRMATKADQVWVGGGRDF